MVIFHSFLYVYQRVNGVFFWGVKFIKLKGGVPIVFV